MNIRISLVVTALSSLVLNTSYSSAQTTEKESKLRAQTSDTLVGWKKGGTIALNFNQVGLSNWASGGESSISFSSLYSAFATYKKGKGVWENNIDIAYGTIKQGNGARWEKTDDRLDFTSKYGKKAYKDWYYAGLFNFRSQLAPGYEDDLDSLLISNFLAPAYITLALGFDYKPSKVFTMFLAPATAKITIVGDQGLADLGAYGVDAAEFDATGTLILPGANVRQEFGGYARFLLKKDLMENVNLQTELKLFSNYLENAGNIDINWDLLLSMKINKYLSATISTQLIYDDDIDIAVDNDDDGITDEIGPRTQFKEVIGIGFSYKF